MKLLSSRMTSTMKWVLPAFWFGIVIATLIAGGIATRAPHQPVLWIPCAIMLLFGVILFRLLLWDLADEVQDCGGYLMVRRGSVQERVELSNLVNVSMSQFTSPRRLTLRLRQPGALGDEVVFIPRAPFQLNPFARNPVAENLIQRMDHLRAQVRA